MTFSQSLPLQGIRVLSVDNYEAGNYGAALLAAHGAEVVKIEIPGKGDVLRSAGPFSPPVDGAPFSHGEVRLMRGKRSVELDLRGEEGRAVFRDLIRKADVFWTNLRPNSRVGLGLDWPTLHECNPRLVYVSITGFGLTRRASGNDPNTPAFDIIIQALSGLLERNAFEGVPQYNGIPLADQAASLFACMGTLAALVGGQLHDADGVCVDVAMYDAAVAFNEKAVTVYGLTGELPRPQASVTSAPFGVYRARDGYFVVGVGGNPVWARFVRVVGRPDLLDDPTLRDGSDRVPEEGRIRTLIEDWAAERRVEEVVAELLKAEVPAAPVRGLEDLLAGPFDDERGIIRNLAVGDLSFPVVTTPVQFLDGGHALLEPPHRLGADTDAVLAEWLDRAPARG